MFLMDPILSETFFKAVFHFWWIVANLHVSLWWICTSMLNSGEGWFIICLIMLCLIIMNQCSNIYLTFSYQEQYKLKTEVFGCLPALSKSEYETFFKTTGIDLDDRQKIMDFFAKGMEHGVMRFVTFAKAIPGFTDLPVCDQVNLIKCKYPLKMFSWLWQFFALTDESFGRQIKYFVLL